MTAEPGGWSRGQRRLHWWTAMLVPLGFALGWLMVAVPLRDLLAKFLLYQAHKTIGILVFLITLGRLLIRWRRGRPGHQPALPEWQMRAAALGQATLYLLLAVVPVLGYFTAASAPAAIPTLFFLLIPVPHLIGTDPALFALLRQVHRALAVLLVLLASGHAAIAVRHHLRGHPVLRRMWGGPARDTPL